MTDGRKIDEIITRMCDDYCRYPREWDEGQKGVELIDSGICDSCPLNKLAELDCEEWHPVSEKPDRDEVVMVQFSGKVNNIVWLHAFSAGEWDDERKQWYIEEPNDYSDEKRLTVEAWRYYPGPYEGGAK